MCVQLTLTVLICSGEAGGQILAAALTPDNKKISEFLVDLSLPMALFEQLSRRDTGKKGKKGKKKK